jgi:hypothetical protein
LVDCVDVSDQALLSFLQARADSEEKNVTRLKRATVSFSRVKEVDIMTDLVPLVATGMEVKVQYLPTGETRKSPVCSPWTGLNNRYLWHSNWEGRWVSPYRS